MIEKIDKFEYYFDAFDREDAVNTCRTFMAGDGLELFGFTYSICCPRDQRKINATRSRLKAFAKHFKIKKSEVYDEV